jgi:hypothetical protein
MKNISNICEYINNKYWGFFPFGELSYWEYSHKELFINLQSYDLQGKDIFPFGEFFPLGNYPIGNFMLWGIILLGIFP